jgi:pimeloyl-ACP methyl ester carboxylesterase
VDNITPFRIEASDADLNELRDRLRKTRWPSGVDGQGWARGVDLDVLRDLCDYWADGFDWRAQEAELNRFAQVMIDVDGLATHAIHVRSAEDDAIPLVLSHGWPGSFAEFRSVIGPLSDPVAHGGDRRDAFHVVCPSLPGYGFSAAPNEPGWDVRRVGAHIARLMSELGYERFAAQGGDWGAMATHWMALDVPERLVGVHLNLVMAAPPSTPDPLAGLSESESARLKRNADLTEAGGFDYVMQQGRAPHTLAPALSDSPAGLAAWILEKFHIWVDHQGDLFDAVSRDDLLTHLTIYWLGNTIGSSIELYYESMRTGTMAPPPRRVEVPTGGALMPHDLFAPPRTWADPLFNIVRWTEFEHGGHFAALERPDEFVRDVRAFFAPLR